MENKIVYGAKCTWWDDKEKAVIIESTNLPGCPFCGSVLFEQDKKTWEKLTDNFNEPGYKKMMVWSKGKCFPDLATLKKEYKKAVKHG